MQFETIHPFLDGNGRIGRLLIVRQRVADGALREAMLDPSLFFKTHRALYYELPSRIRRHGGWERWLDFFAEGVESSATQGVATANALLAQVKATWLTPATVNRSLAHLERLGIVGETTNRQRGRVFSYRQYVAEPAAEFDPPSWASSTAVASLPDTEARKNRAEQLIV